MRLVRTLAAVTIALAGLTACGDDEPHDPPEDAGSSPSAQASPEVSDPAPGPASGSGAAEQFDDQGHEVHRGSVITDTAEEEAVAQAWLDYWKVRLEAYGEAEVTVRELGKVATGTAAENVTGRVAELQAEGLHLEGDTRFGVSEIRVRGDRASLVSCGENKGTDRHADGSSAEKLKPFFNYTAQLRQAGETWLVSSANFGGYAKCDAGGS